MDHAFEPVPAGRLEDVPESAHVDGERGFRVFLNGAVAGEEDSGVDDRVDAVDRPVHGVEIGDVAMHDLALVPRSVDVLP